jgi:2-oxo-4-hydroxy-4-carboxy-5-ureidoimidazoline decarboxylase
MSQFRTLQPSQLNRAEFIAALGDIYEHSPWVAEQAFERLAPDQRDDIEAVHACMSRVVADADRTTLLALINAHPDLAGKAAVRGELTAASTQEQAGAGISQCTPEEFQRFTQLNDEYRARFGFPFIMAVKGSDRGQILAAFETRIGHSPEDEFACALREIDKIALFRLQAL